MNLHEYQGKNILDQHGVRIQRGVVLDNIGQIEKLSKELIDETGAQIGLLLKPKFMLVVEVKVEELSLRKTWLN